MKNTRLKHDLILNWASLAALILLSALGWPVLAQETERSTNDPAFRTRGIILDVNDLSTVDWPKLAKEVGLTTIGTHITPSQVAEFYRSEKGKSFVASCREHGIEIEHELHAIGDLLPRSLFEKNPNLFRMNAEGQRMADFNLCVHSDEALKIVTSNAIKYAKLLPSTTHRYFFWIDDGAPMCQCPECQSYSDSDQALIVENAIVKGLRSQVSSSATLAHLAYHNTLKPPTKVKPDEGIFLEYAPFHRSWSHPLREANRTRKGSHVSHGEYIRLLDENLKVFPVETAQVLEYWLDVSLFSGWKKPAVKLPWNKSVFLDDIDFYSSRGIRHVTTFGVYMDKDYFEKYPDLTFLKEYGVGLNTKRGN